MTHPTPAQAMHDAIGRSMVHYHSKKAMKKYNVPKALRSYIREFLFYINQLDQLGDIEKVLPVFNFMEENTHWGDYEASFKQALEIYDLPLYLSDELHGFIMCTSEGEYEQDVNQIMAVLKYILRHVREDRSPL